MVKIGSLELGTRPGIVGIIDEMIAVNQIAELVNMGVNLLEMRVDCFSTPLKDIVSYMEKIRKAINIPFIGTVRENENNKGKRLEIFKAIADFVDCVDIELGTSISDDIKACYVGKTILVSEHDFEKTPSIDVLHNMVQRAVAQGADIVKVAVMTKSTADVRRLLRFTEECKVPLVSIGMGPIGTVTRVIAPLFGSLFTYGYLTHPVAPGQLSAKKLADEIALYFPDMKK